MAQTISLAAEPRTATGKGAARQTRFQHKVPAVVYGHGRPSQPLTVDAQALEQALTGIDPESTLFELTIEGQKRSALIREIQRHPLRPDIIHVDFYEIRAEEQITLRVPVHLAGVPDGVRNAGGVLDQVMREVQIEVLPRHIPERVELDVTALLIGNSLHVSDLKIADAKILDDGALTICTVVPPRAEEVAAPAAEAAAEVAEPELIRKPREDEEGEGAEGEGAGGAAPAKGEKAGDKGEKPKGGKES